MIAAACARSHTNVGGASVADYSAHHQPFQYYASTANPHHLPPSSATGIGHTDAASHQYDLTGWYDHQPSPNVNASQSPQDALTASGICGSTATPLAGFQNRCGYGPRLPLLVISPFAKQNFVDHTVTDQTSILRFVEDNWLSGQRIGGGSFDALAGPLTGMFDFPHRHAGNLILDPATGTQG
jgi:phospholipase C